MSMAELAYQAQAIEDVGRRKHFGVLVRSSWLLRIGLAIVAVALLLAAIGPEIAPRSPTEATAAARKPPSSTYWFGTDGSGFDVFSRVISAPRIDVAIALTATAVSFAAGSILGLLASAFRGRVGELSMRFVDVAQAFPVFVLAIIVVTGAGHSFLSIVSVVAILNLPIFLKLIRSQVLSLREQLFVEAARATGGTGMRIAFRHVLPNAIGPGLAQASITMGFSILMAAGLSFIGAGVQPPTPEWGAMIAAGANDIVIGQWWSSVFPGLAMVITVFGFAIVGDALQSIFLRRT